MDPLNGLNNFHAKLKLYPGGTQTFSLAVLVLVCRLGFGFMLGKAESIMGCYCNNVSHRRGREPCLSSYLFLKEEKLALIQRRYIAERTGPSDEGDTRSPIAP